MKNLVIIFGFVILMCSCGKKPEADFTWAPVSPKAGETVTFTNFSKDAKSYSWNFGDMSIGSDKNPVHIYKNAGNYIIDLTASSGLNSDIKTVTIKVIQ